MGLTLYAFLARQFLLLSDQIPGAIGISIRMGLDVHTSTRIREQGSISTKYHVICIRKTKSDEAQTASPLPQTPIPLKTEMEQNTHTPLGTRLRVNRTRFASGLGLLLAGLTFAIEKLARISHNPVTGAAQKTLFILIVPGIIGAMGIEANIHAWHLWVAAAINGLIHFGIGWFLYGLVAKYRRG